MDSYQYVIIGGGMAAAAAVQGIRDVDQTGTIAMISAENHPPYKRPPLTKKLWQGKPETIIWSDFPGDALTMINGCRVVAIDADQQQIRDAAGTVYGYQRLLLATGGTPRRLPFGGEDLLYFRTLDDYHTLRGWTGQGARFGVIGGGFIGSEVAAALAMNGEQVVMAFPEDTIGARVFPTDLAKYVTDYYRQKGVEVHTGMEIHGIERKGSKFLMQTTSGQPIAVDHIIGGIGIRPNTELAQSAGLAIGGAEAGHGILVDEHLLSSRPGIYAAGDAAAFYSPVLDRVMRVEHADNADTMGRIAGQNMAGQSTPYQHQPFFYSDLFDLGYEAVGELDPRLETFADWVEPFRQGVVYYLKDQRVRGVLLWNTWDQVDAARKLIQEGKRHRKEDLKGRLPEK